MSKISIFTQLQSNTSISGVGLCKIASAQKKKMHTNMTQKDVSFVQVDAAVTMKCWTSLLRDRKQPTAYQVIWTVCLCQTAFCFIFILLKSITAFKLTCLSAVCVHVWLLMIDSALGKAVIVCSDFPTARAQKNLLFPVLRSPRSLRVGRR